MTRDGATLRREGGLLQVFVRRERVAELSLQGIEQLVLVGNVTLTPRALDLVLEAGVDTVFLSHHGRYRGRIVHGLSANIRLRLAQVHRLDDPIFACAFAKAVVDGKLANARSFLQRFARRHGDDGSLSAAVRALAAGRARLEVGTNVDELRGVEGAGAATYFGVFGKVLRAPGFTFDGRNRRPPLDPVNALLSLGYTFLTTAVEAQVHTVGLDPYLGALHAPLTGRPSLVCDLVEEWRVPVVDALVVAAINRGVINTEDFEDLGEGEPVVVKRPALGAFARLFERRLATPVLYRPTNMRLPLRNVIEQQVRHLARVLLGDDQAYLPYLTE